MIDTSGGLARFSYMRRLFKERLLEKLEADNEGDMVLARRVREQALHIYFLNLVGITLFTDNSAHYVDVAYLKYFRDLDQLVVGYAWGAAALAHLYMELNNVSHYNIKHLSGYLSLLQVKIN